MQNYPNNCPTPLQSFKQVHLPATSDNSLMSYRRSLVPETLNLNDRNEAELQVLYLKIFHNETLIHSLPIKEGMKLKLIQDRLYDFEIGFKVNGGIVYGLSIVNSIYKSFIRLNKDEHKQGTFAPGQNVQIGTFSMKAPGGILGRGSYSGEAMVKDKLQKIYTALRYDVDIVSQN